MTELYVIKSTYKKNANDGIQYFNNKHQLAHAVYEAETSGATVQVYKCVPVNHEVYVGRVGIELYGKSK